MTEEELNAVSAIKNGGIGVLKSDTLYGIVGSALSKSAVNRIYEVKGRDYNKPLIVLISNYDQLLEFGIDPALQRAEYKKYWPGPNTLIHPIKNKSFEYIHRGTKSIAFRLPAKPNLVEFIDKTGPLVAPSANPQGKEPAPDINTAKEYFGDSVDFYIDSGLVKGVKPSTIINLATGQRIR